MNYYYDQAENLVKTIPPQGVHPITATASLDSIINYRAGLEPKPVYPQDSLASRYWFNTLNSPVQQNTPDGDTAAFFYDRLGRLVLSQNAVQKPYLFSYTLYDAIGRIIEVGQMNSYIYVDSASIFVPRLPLSHAELDSITRNDAALQNFFYYVGSPNVQVTHTFYDTVAIKHIPLAQTNLRKRISAITYTDVQRTSDTLYDNAIHYTYDIEGNVASIISEDMNDTALRNQYKRTDYFYDLVSGKVNQIDYQRNQPDFFMHSYEYDADNRITNVLTSSDSLNWTQEASYEYYSHGPLAREVIGRRAVQGVDYAYTLNGWIKGVNSSITNASFDMGQDGNVHDANATVGRDAMGFTLNYFNGDYRPIGGKTFEALGLQDTSLFNGNIAAATYSLSHLLPKTMGWVYHYDQLNRYLRQQGYINPDSVNNNWSTGTPTASMAERVSYEENGNILSYVRHGNAMAGSPLAMDSLNYHYKKGTNQLVQVNDAVPDTNYPNDIHNQTSKRNYQYNAIGQLAKDSAGKLDTITWTIYGKIHKIVLNRFVNNLGGRGVDSIVFEYDPLGNRIEKRNYTYYVATSHSVVKRTNDTTLYSRDAQGNILAVYNRQRDSIWLNEFDLYGSKRIGVIDTNMLVGAPYIACSCTPLANPFDTSRTGYLEGQRRYELTNHLGNVLVTVNDRKLPVDTTGTPNVANYYQANVINANDYYPYGMPVPGRSFSLAGDTMYRFGFNGKLKDNDIYGKGNSYDYGARFYDPRLGIFLSIDPLGRKYPMLTPYQFASLSPISGVDLDGLEYYYAPDGSLLGNVGTDTKVRLINQNENTGKAMEFISLANQGMNAETWAIISNSISSDVGLSNAELNTRAMLSTIRQTEGHGTQTKYDTKYGGGTMKDYKEHPPKVKDKSGVPHSPAGAFQITLGTWNEAAKKLGLKDFSPANQDKAAVQLMKDAAGAYNKVIGGDVEGAVTSLKGTWSSLPGGTEPGMTLTETKSVFKNNVAKELHHNSDLSTPQGKLDSGTHESVRNLKSSPNQ